MATLNTISLWDFVSLEEIDWLKTSESLSSAARQSGIFKVGTWEPNTGEFRKYDEIDGEEYAHIKDEGDDAIQAKVQQGYSKTAELRRFGVDIPVTWEMRQRNKYQSAIQKLTNLRVQTANRIELDLTHRITFGTATSYSDLDGRTVDISVGDTLALFSTAHTLRGSATTYRNIVSGNPQFSKAALESMEKLAVEQTFNQFGTLQTMSFDIVFSGPDPNTCNTIRELLQSTAEVSSQNNGVVNVYKGKYRHVILPRLATTATGAPDTTKAKYWGIASSQWSSAYFDVEQEPTLDTPSMGANSEEFSSEDWTFRSRASYAICIVGGKFIKLSKGDGTA